MTKRKTRFQILILLLLFQLALFSQKESPYVLNVEQREGMFSATIGDKGAKFYLRSEGYTYYGKDWMELRGWFQFNDSDLQEQVSGIYIGQDLILFSGIEIQDSVELYTANFNDEWAYRDTVGVWEVLDSIKPEHYDRKFRQSGNKRYTQSGDESSHFRIHLDASKLFNQKEYLIFPNGRLIDLETLNIMAREFTVVAYGDSNVLLQYFYTSNTWNPGGRCGAGYEHGLYILDFNQQGDYQGVRHIPLESCLGGLYAEWEFEGSQLMINTMNSGTDSESNSYDFSVFKQDPQTIAENMRPEEY